MTTTTRYRVPMLALRMVRERTLTLTSDRATTPIEAAAIARGIIGKRPTEHLLAIMIDGRGNVTSIATIAQGGMHGASIRAADVLRAVLTSHAAGFILAHNHPSGDPTPSPEDRTFTAAIIQAADAIGVPMLDHVIVTRTDAFSSVVERT